MIKKSLVTTIISISFIIGILTGLNLPPFNLLSILLLFSATILFYFSNSKLIYYSVTILGITIGSIIIQHNISNIQNYNLLKYDQKYTITGTITYPPEIRNNKQQIILSKIQDNDNQQYNGNLLIFASPFPPLNYHDQIQIKAKISKPENFTEDFSYIGYLSLRNIYYTAYYPKINLLSPPKVGGVPEGRGGISIFFQYLYKFRDFILNQINHALPYPQSGLLAGLLLGYKNALPPDLYEQFRVAGLTHIIVVSGFNLTIFATLFLKNLRGYIPRLLLLLLTIVSILIFTLLTGAESSIVRAFFMSIILISAPFLSRKNNPTIAILLAACIMIFINPLILWYDAGFHLSFLATFGLVYISPIISNIKFLKIFPDYISSTLSETLSAMIPTTPYIATSFHQISLVALLSNILVLPLIPITMAFGAMSILLSFVPQISSPINLITSSLLSYIILIGQKLSQIPYSSININISKTTLFITSIIIILTIYIISKSKLSPPKKT